MADLRQDSHAFVNTLGGASLRKDLRFKLFKGASIQFKDTKNAEESAAKVAEMPKIKRVYPVRRYPVPRHVVRSKGTGVQEMIAKREVSGNDTFSTHLMTQVNKFRDAGITGKGIKIAVIDTGVSGFCWRIWGLPLTRYSQIDYKHPALGGCFGPGCLVSYGTDLVGSDFDGSNTPVPDPDPWDNCNGHGTHVAGIIAAQSNNPYGIIGAAQDVTLGAYRVFGCEGEVGNDILIAAYNMAYEAGSDIITASIGGPSGWPEDPWAAVVSRIVENGVPCVVSAGNDGATGIFYAAAAANGDKVTAIASIDNTVSPSMLTKASFFVDGGEAQTFGFTAGQPGDWNNVTLPVWAVSFNTSNPADGCTDEDWASAPDLSGHVVLVRRGSCAFTEKGRRAVEKGAKHIIYYNNAAGTSTPSAATPGIVASAMISADTGAAWIKALSGGAKLVVNMPDPLTGPQFVVNEVNTATGGFASDYTQWGPTFELKVKPQLASPGGMILSTYPTALGGYAVLSGTSMACPLAAAVYALLINVRGTKDPRTLENLLSATAHPNLFRLNGESPNLLAPVIQQGAGLIQAWDAAHATTLLSTSSLAFNDTDNFNRVQQFDISNTGNKAVTYLLSNVGAAMAYSFANETTHTPAQLQGELELTADFAKLSFEPSKFTIPAGGRKMIKVTASPPKGVNAKRLPVYSGYITVNGTDGSALSLPYMGVVGSMRSLVVLERNSLELNRRRNAQVLPVQADMTLVLAPPGYVNDTSYNNRTDKIELAVNLDMGTALLRADVVPVGKGHNNHHRPPPHKYDKNDMIFGDVTVGQIDSFPLSWNPRGKLEFRWDGKLNDGTYAPAGQYKLVVRALRIFGDQRKAHDYDTAETVSFKIEYLPKPAKRRAAETIRRRYVGRNFG